MSVHRALIQTVSIALTALLCGIALAAPSEKLQCEERAVDHRTSKCMPKLKAQTDTNLCYAYGLAELVSFSTCLDISPSAIAIVYNQNFKKKEVLEGYGYTRDALKASNDFGFCLEEDVRSQVYLNGKFESMVKLYNNLLYTEAEWSDRSNRVCRYTGAPNPSYLLFPGSSVLEVLNHYTRTELDRLYRLVETSCKTRIRKRFRLETVAKCDDLDAIDMNLKQQPLSIASNKNSDENSPVQSNHVSTLVGLQWNSEKGTCDYILKNSLGANGQGTYSRISKNEFQSLCKDGSITGEILGLKQESE